MKGIRKCKAKEVYEKTIKECKSIEEINAAFNDYLTSVYSPMKKPPTKTVIEDKE